MARRRPADRFQQLVEAATRVFIASGGFKRTSIDEVARELGVAKGTLYLYVESKEALFDLVLRRADQGGLEEPELPVRTPAPGATLAYLRDRMSLDGLLSELDEIMSAPRPARSAREELERLFDALYDVMSANRTAIRLVNASAFDMPELAEIWFGSARGGLNARLADYLDRRARNGDLLPMPEPAAAARFLTETIHRFAVARAFDPLPDATDDDTARATARVAILRVFLPAEEAA